jgi:3-oxoisoapionate decarboxylase
MQWNRREWLVASAGAVVGLTARADGPVATARPRMGVVIHSYGFRRFSDPLEFLGYCATIGAGGAQTAIGVRADAYADKLLELAAKHKVYLEGSIGFPRDKDDLERFSAEVRTAKRCGAKLFRTVMSSGRRYEVFDSAEAFRAFHERAKRGLGLARPVVEKHEIRMAIENHKDLQAPDLAELIKKVDSPWVGVCLDTGNNIALLEKPEETVEALAPFAFTTHMKDMGVEEYADGFLLAEVPFGHGFLDLAAICGAVRKAKPDATFNIEMMTRDPLKVPCLTPKYWATLEQTVPARRLAEMLALVKAKAPKKPLPRISQLPKEEQIKREDENVRECLRYAREKLGA